MSCSWPAGPARPVPGPRDVHVWFVDLAEAGDLSSLLDEEERHRAGRYLHPAPREQFVAARGSLRRLLARYVGTAPQHIRFTTSGNGKPRLPGDEVRFNVSHSGGVALIAVARELELGVDIEGVRERETYPDLARRYFTPAEADAVRDLRTFYHVWTRKEAFLKALGLGLAHGLERFRVSVPPDDPARIVQIDGDEKKAARWTLQALEPTPEDVAALAVEATELKVVCWKLAD